MPLIDSEFNPSGLSGNVTVTDRAAAFSKQIVQDATTEGTEKFRAHLRQSSVSGNIVASTGVITINDTSQEATASYGLSASSATINEGSSVTITLTTINVTNGTSVPYTITGVNSADIGGASLTGSFTVNSSGTATMTITLTAAADLTTEGSETLTLTLNSITPTVAVSVTIVDSSITPGPTYALAASPTTVNEGQQTVFTLTTTGVSTGTLVPYTITGVTSNDISAGLTGSFSVGSNGTATLTVVVAADATTEGSEIMTLTLNGITPTVSAAVTINDTSLTATYSLSGNVSAANEGSTVRITLTTQNVSNGTVVPFSLSGTNINDSDLVASGLVWDSGNNRFNGAFTVNSNTAYIDVNTTEDLTTEGSESFAVTLSAITPSVTTSITINDTSTLITGSATFSLSQGTIATLPTQATWLAFKMIGAGGSGGGGDAQGPGGSGGPGSYVTGVVQLPATGYSKVLRGGVGMPGFGGSGLNLSSADSGGIGFTSLTLTGSLNGGNGALDGPSGFSGGGGAGGGCSSIWFGPNAGSQTLIATAAGGGGGGGGTRNTVTAGHANSSNPTYVPTTGEAGTYPGIALSGTNGTSPAGDGGGGGGGGAPGGTGGVGGADNSVAATGGNAGFCVQNRTDLANWSSFSATAYPTFNPTNQPDFGATAVPTGTPQPYPWIYLGRGGRGSPTTNGIDMEGWGGQMGAISVYWTNAVSPPNLNLVPGWTEPSVTVTLPAEQSVDSIRIKANGTFDYLTSSGWVYTTWVDNGPYNGIGEWYECRVTSLAPSNGAAQGNLTGDFSNNSWTIVMPKRQDMYNIGVEAGSTNQLYAIDVLIEIRRRSTGVVVAQRYFRNLSAYGSEPPGGA